MKLLQGDCLAILPTLETESIDSIVTDPPAGISFMGKGWDGDRGGRRQWISWMAEVMAECLRVLKPGGHALVWALPRTSHWTATACEDAGFEIRDVIHHLFGSGFPKSHDISKAIDREAGAEREIVGRLPQPASAKVGTFNCSFDDDKAVITAPATPEAVQWAGWGTALKPAAENWILCRKPFPGTVAANVLEHGTGGLNIDAGRIEGDNWNNSGELTGGDSVSDYGDGLNNSGRSGSHDLGRFPSNLILTHSAECGETCAPDCPCGEIDKNPKTQTRIRNPFISKTSGNTYDLGLKPKGVPSGVTTGLPSSYFRTFRYHPKISAQDREDGNTHSTVKPTDLMRYFINLITPPGGVCLDPFMGSGSTGKAAILDGFDFVGIEQDPEYFKIAKARIHNAGSQPGLF